MHQIAHICTYIFKNKFLEVMSAEPHNCGGYKSPLRSLSTVHVQGSTFSGLLQPLMIV